MTGNSTQRITIRGGTIYDRSHGMILNAPNGWIPTATEGGLFAMMPPGRGQTQQTYFSAQEVETRQLQGYNVQDAVRRQFQQMGLQYVGARNVAMRSGQQFTV